MARNTSGSPNPKQRYGTGEWYGRVFSELSPKERRLYAEMQFVEKGERQLTLCPFRSGGGLQVTCSKEGGVCSIRRYELDPQTESVSVAPGADGELVTTCPHRFKQKGAIFRWVGEKLLGTSSPLVVGEVPFLERRDAPDGKARKVGRIDSILVHPDLSQLKWCALEIQAVYFSGRGMKEEFRVVATKSSSGLPFPTTNRRPDFRSSGPKRLMPQLQTKVPTLRRWGKRMAVVVDRSFFGALGKIREVGDISSCDIAWFVVRFDSHEGKSVISLDSVRYTRLEDAVEGLTGGDPVPQDVFEKRIRQKLSRPHAGS